MTEDDKKLIDACKDRAIQQVLTENEQIELPSLVKAVLTNGGFIQHCVDRAMQIYGEMCRKEGDKEGYKRAQFNFSVGDYKEN